MIVGVICPTSSIMCIAGGYVPRKKRVTKIKSYKRLRLIILTYPWRLQVWLNVVKTLQPLGRSYEKYSLKLIVREFIGWSM